MPEQFYLTVTKDGNPLFSTQPTRMKGMARAAYQHLKGRMPITEGYEVAVHETNETDRDVTADFR